MRYRIAVGGVLLFTLSGCVAALAAPSLLVGGGSYLGIKSYTKHAMSQADRQLASAQAIGGDLNLSAIKVSKPTTEGNTVHWIAEVPDGRLYACSEEKGHTTATCVKQR